MFAYFDGVMSRQEATERIKKNTRGYAKKQIAWHKARLRRSFPENLRLISVAR